MEPTTNPQNSDTYKRSECDRRPQWVRDHIATKTSNSLTAKGKRLQEIIGLLITWALMAVDLYILWWYFHISNIFHILLYSLLGVISADFIGGFMHWLSDTWGSVDTPIVGRLFIRMVRLHHYDPTEFTHHTFLDTNADNFALSIPFLLPSFVVFLYSSPAGIAASYNWICYLFVLSLFGSLTNQLHKWAHTHTGLPPFVAFLQKHHLILPPLHHLNHHLAPRRHETHFCITVGWLNYPLEHIHFWEWLESCIKRITGYKPRSAEH